MLAVHQADVGVVRFDHEFEHRVVHGGPALLGRAHLELHHAVRQIADMPHGDVADVRVRILEQHAQIRRSTGARPVTTINRHRCAGRYR